MMAVARADTLGKIHHAVDCWDEVQQVTANIIVLRFLIVLALSSDSTSAFSLLSSSFSLSFAILDVVHQADLASVLP